METLAVENGRFEIDCVIPLCVWKHVYIVKSSITANPTNEPKIDVYPGHGRTARKNVASSSWGFLSVEPNYKNLSSKWASVFKKYQKTKIYIKLEDSKAVSWQHLSHCYCKFLLRRKHRMKSYFNDPIDGKSFFTTTAVLCFIVIIKEVLDYFRFISSVQFLIFSLFWVSHVRENLKVASLTENMRSKRLVKMNDMRRDKNHVTKRMINMHVEDRRILLLRSSTCIPWQTLADQRRDGRKAWKRI